MRIKLVLGLALSILFALGANYAFGQLDEKPLLTPFQKRLLSGSASHALALQENANVAISAPPDSIMTVTSPSPCAGNFGSNVRVNRNCQNLSDTDLAGHGQANNSPSIAQDPNNLSHLVAADSDFRTGDENCMAAFSLNSGVGWQDSLIPLGFTRGSAFGGFAREYWEASGDASVAWDTKGNSYIACLAFQRGMPAATSPDQSSAVYVFRSTGSHGASWNFPGRPAVESAVFPGVSGPIEDKPYMTVDAHAGSPFQDRIYVTWTEFAPDGTAYIWQSFSNDYGQTFSGRVLVSENNPTLCPNPFGGTTPQGNCNENQFSQPFTGPNGSLYVAFQNFNNAVIAPDNHFQILLAKSVDGGNTFSAPVKVADFYDLPDCFTYQGQDNGRSCVPEKGSSKSSFFRAENYPVGAVNPGNAMQVVVTFGSYINIDSRGGNGCAPMGFSTLGLPLYRGVKTLGACNNKILLSVSTNGGLSFTGATTSPRSLPTINQAAGQATTDQWWQWASFTSVGKLAVSYYDRQYGTDETTGFMDVSLSSSSNLLASSTVRVTTSSMPPPTQFGGLFMGDYSGLSAVDANAHPVWVDTRNRQLFLCPGTGIPNVPPTVCEFTSAAAGNDQDIYTETLLVP